MSKHENLLLMHNAGINVPPFVIINSRRIIDFLNNRETYQTLCIDYKWEFVSVRSSGNYSTPGRMETILNVNTTNKDLKHAVDKVFRSSQSSSVREYLKIKKIEDFEMKIIVQKMIKADENRDWSGVLTTIHPITQTKQMYANCAIGQNGAELMSGKITPQSIKNVHDIKGINSLRKQVKMIEKLFDKPQEIEFVVKDSVAYILQSRDFNPVEVKSQLQVDDIMLWCDIVAQGQSATPFDCIGNITMNKKDCKGKILYTEFTDFEDTENIIDCLGIITRTGGTLSHAAIIAREFKKPCIVGVQLNMQIYKDDLFVMHHKGGIFKKK